MEDLNKTDLPDSEKDKKKLRPDKATIDLPDIEDIPGQESTKPLETDRMEDLTIHVYLNCIIHTPLYFLNGRMAKNTFCKNVFFAHQNINC